MPALRRDLVIVGLLWLLLTMGGEVGVLAVGLPLAASREAAIADDAFLLLMILSVPVLTFVAVMLAYSVLRFRVPGQPSRDGPPVRTHRLVIGAWFLLTSGLTLLIIVHPGVTGMAALASRAQEDVDLVVRVTALRYAWRFEYPDYNIAGFEELVVPVNKHVRFEVTSVDVLHSFWVPAFRAKIDAVPGLTTTTDATPDRTGTFQQNINFRVQCAELCGINHTTMSVPVRVLEQSEFDAWVAQRRGT